MSWTHQRWTQGTWSTQEGSPCQWYHRRFLSCCLDASKCYASQALPLEWNLMTPALSLVHSYCVWLHQLPKARPELSLFNNNWNTTLLFDLNFPRVVCYRNVLVCHYCCLGKKKLRHCQQRYQVLGVLTSYSRRDGGTDKFKKVCILPSFPST